MIPIVFAFDNNLAMPAAVCIYSLFANAGSETRYQVYILHRKGNNLDVSYVNKVFSEYPHHELKLIEVDGTFDNSFKIRGITTPAYYRLLIPSLIPEHDKVIYSDVDVIFRDDLTDIYNTDLGNSLYGGVNATVSLDKDLNEYYVKLGLDTSKIIYSGNLIINCREFRENPQLMRKLIETAQNDYKFQDMDAINLVCRDRISYLGPEFCLTTYISSQFIQNPTALDAFWDRKQVLKALDKGIVHYNGVKPWQGWCLNFDIWWEYYRKSPIFDPEFYFKFYYNRLEELDTLPLMKRVKNLVRYFVYGRKKLI